MKFAVSGFIFYVFVVPISGCSAETCGQVCNKNWTSNSSHCWTHTGCDVTIPGAVLRCHGQPCTLKVNVMFLQQGKHPFKATNYESALNLTEENIVFGIKRFHLNLRFYSVKKSSNKYNVSMRFYNITHTNSGDYSVTILDKSVSETVFQETFVIKVLQLSHAPTCHTNLVVNMPPSPYWGYMLTCSIVKDYLPAGIKVLSTTDCINFQTDISNDTHKIITLFFPFCENMGSVICVTNPSKYDEMFSNKTSLKNCTFDIKNNQKEKFNNILSTIDEPLFDWIVIGLILFLLMVCLSLFVYVKKKMRAITSLSVQKKALPGTPAIAGKRKSRLSRLLRTTSKNSSDDDYEKCENPSAAVVESQEDKAHYHNVKN